MWGRRKRTPEESTADTASATSAREGIEYAERVIAHVEAQQPEINQMVARLTKAAGMDPFGEGLMEAMEKRR